MYISAINYLSKNAPEQFNAALLRTGFAVIRDTCIDSHNIQVLYEEWLTFFSSENKRKYLYNNDTQEGYFPFRFNNAVNNQHKDLMEFYNIYPWGKYPTEVSKLALTFYHELTTLGKTLLSWLDQQLPPHIRQALAMPLVEITTDTKRNLMRIVHYPPLTGDEQTHEIRAAAHTDINLLTLLPSPNLPGLQIKDPYGNWHSIQSQPGDIIVNVGNMLEMLTKKHFQSTVHRVLNAPTHLNRISMPLFIHPRDEIQLSKKYTAISYLHAVLDKNGIRQSHPHGGNDKTALHAAIST